jgi:hypothetical protein
MESPTSAAECGFLFLQLTRSYDQKYLRYVDCKNTDDRVIHRDPYSLNERQTDLCWTSHKEAGRWLSSGMLRLVVWQKFNGISEVLSRPDDGDSKHLWNVCKLLPDTGHKIPEDSNLHTRRRENIKTHT